MQDGTYEPYPNNVKRSVIRIIPLGRGTPLAMSKERTSQTIMTETPLAGQLERQPVPSQRYTAFSHEQLTVLFRSKDDHK